MNKCVGIAVVVVFMMTLGLTGCEDEVATWEEPPSKLVGEWDLYTVDYWDYDDTLRGTLKVEADGESYTGRIYLRRDTVQILLPITYLWSSNFGESFEMLTGDIKLKRDEYWHTIGRVYPVVPDSIYSEATHYNPWTGFETWRRVYGRRVE